MNQLFAKSYVLFITFFMLSDSTAMQAPRIASIAELEQKTAPKEWALGDIEKRKRQRKLYFLDGLFVFEAIRIRDSDYLHRELSCLASVAGKKCIVNLFLEKEENSLHVFWEVLSVVDDFKRPELLNPFYDLASSGFWISPILDHNTSFLRQLFCAFVGRYIIHLDGDKILSQKCRSCGKSIALSTDIELVISPHYRLSHGGVLCERCGFPLSLKIPKQMLHIKAWSLPPYAPEFS
jgi:hypothetical protein